MPAGIEADPLSGLTGLSVDAALAALRTSPAGLAPAEVGRRLAEFGPNQLEDAGWRQRRQTSYRVTTRDR